MRFSSLRARLVIVILLPLLAISLAAGAWQVRATAERAENIFDRGLLSAALAISRDIAVSDGDALSPATRSLVNDTSGGELFYHVFAPDGVFVTGYSTPPVLPSNAPDDLAEPYYYNAQYQREQVRVLRFQDVTTVSDVSGVFNITVWQSADVRSSFVQEVVIRFFAVLATLIFCVFLIVWFGVGLGLRPLVDLEEAIGKRTPSELEPIQRPVPVEAKGLVKTLNALLDQVSRRISSKDEFISNAAHQLRNPIAGVLALAEAVQNAPDEKSAKRRSAELVDAARETSQLTNQLLSFERASGADVASTGSPLDLCDLVEHVTEAFRGKMDPTKLKVITITPSEPVLVHGDRLMLHEAILNLLTNARVHGGPDLTKIEVTLTQNGREVRLAFQDDGRGIPPNKHVEAISRFSQAGGGPGSGLGLPIAAKVMENHHGKLEIAEATGGALIVLKIPLSN